MSAGPSRVQNNAIDDAKRERKRKEIAGRLSREMGEHRDDVGRHYADSIALLANSGVQISTRPEMSPAYNLRLYPLTIERSALLTQITMDEKREIDVIDTAYEEERDRVEEEWKRGRDMIRKRLLEGVEERRRKAREEKDGEGNVGDVTLDSQSRPHITRKLRNQLGGSPPHSPLTTAPNGNVPGPVTVGPLVNPHSLSIDELPSPFPLPLTSTQLPYGSSGVTTGGNGRRRNKGGGFQAQIAGGLGKSGSGLSSAKDVEIDADLGEIRRGNKRRRTAATAAVKV